MENLKEIWCASRSIWAGRALIAALATFALLPSQANAATLLQTGVLSCKGDGGWGLIITSTKSFDCTFASSNGDVRGKYTGVIRKFGLDLGKTGATALTWLVFGPVEKVGNDYVPGSLEGAYAGVGAEASVGLGVGANALVGGGRGSFALQPISIQVQTGLSVAAGVQRLRLEYVGPFE